MAKSEAAKSLQRFVRQEYWNGLSAGEVVRVAGHTARGRHWRFRAHVTNTSNGATWVEVVLVDGPAPARAPVPAAAADSADLQAPAPPPRVEQVRSFDPALVTPRWRGRRRMSSLLRSTSGSEGGANPGPAGSDPAEDLVEQASLF
jgi:hypothetical protein